ncbi:MAG: Dolichyl-phosphate-mannose-protein mannosyltransferase [Acidobacteriota bacterium]|nr:Dolichyl-phosphate-mannose-protein mannosyltransferase [Acidobacteriota bacterium]
MSQSVEIDSVGSEALASAQTLARRTALVGERGVMLALAALVVLAFGLRLSGISAIGFAEDEVNKVNAVRAYEHGDITPNAEHPMLMKSLMFVSMRAERAWNSRSANQITDEMALRFPNLLLGALTVIPLFLLTAAFFDRWTGLLAAALWAFGINAITYNRIAKEDTLFVFFMLYAFYFYVRAKQASWNDPKIKRRNYILSGASFGLMLASKYFLQYFGLNMLYHHYFSVRNLGANEPSGKTPWYFYALVAVAFLIANPAVLLPQTWTYLNAWTSEQLLTHSGYLMGEQLYKNTVSSTPFWGTPLYFYVLFLLIKIPLSVLLAFIAGLVVCVRRWRHPGHAFLLLMFVLWIVPYSLFGGKWLRYTLGLIPFVYMIAAVGIVALVRSCSTFFKAANAERALRFAGAMALVVFIAWPAWTAYANRPHYAAYTNALGGGRVGYFFPHDEFYDDGLREAIEFICKTAPQGATIVHETPGVVAYYLEKFGRTDLQSRVLSDASFNLADAPSPSYFILQRGRTYFENQNKMKEVRDKFKKVYEGFVQDVAAVEVYIQ